MMMKAEMAREMTRSRSQMPMPELTRMDGAAMVAPGTATAGAIAASFVPPGPGSVSDMNLYSIQNRFQLLRVVSRLKFTEYHHKFATRNRRVTITGLREPMTRLMAHKILYRSLTLAFLFLVTLTVSAEWS